MPEDLAGIPAALVDRFAKASAEFVEAVGEAVAEAALNPELAGTPTLQTWLTKALPLLHEQNASIQTAAEHFSQDEARSILTLAEDKRGLAKDLDGFPLTFAGPEHAKSLESLETAVVVAAYKLCEAAGIR